MRQHLSFREHFRRGNAEGGGNHDEKRGTFSHFDCRAPGEFAHLTEGGEGDVTVATRRF